MEPGTFPAHLDYVAGYYKLWRSDFTLFGIWSGWSQTKHPFHLIFKAFLTLLLIHSVWLGETLTQLATNICSQGEHEEKHFEECKQWTNFCRTEIFVLNIMLCHVFRSSKHKAIKPGSHTLLCYNF